MTLSLDQIGQLVQNFGIPAVLLGYFVYKDWSFTGRLTELMAKVDMLLEKHFEGAA